MYIEDVHNLEDFTVWLLAAPGVISEEEVRQLLYWYWKTGRAEILSTKGYRSSGNIRIKFKITQPVVIDSRHVFDDYMYVFYPQWHQYGTEMLECV